MSNGQSLLTKRCLLIAPITFYSFSKTVASGLEARGYHVEILNEEFPANSFGKILGKLVLSLLRKFTIHGLKRELDDRQPFDLTFIIKGRGLSVEAVKYLKTRSQRVIAYNFDSFLYNPSPLDWMDEVDRYATFDIQDAVNFDIPLVNLFSGADEVQNVRKEIDFSIIQRVHSNRLAISEKVLKSLPSHYEKFIYLFENSVLTFILNFMRRPFLYLRMWKYISFKPLPYVDAMAKLANSKVTLDYGHTDQSGITVRCFEAQSLGTSILTNNKFSIDSGLFEVGSIALLEENSDEISIRHLIFQLSCKNPIHVRRTLDNFLSDMIDN